MLEYEASLDFFPQRFRSVQWRVMKRQHGSEWINWITRRLKCIKMPLKCIGLWWTIYDVFCTLPLLRLTLPHGKLILILNLAERKISARSSRVSHERRWSDHFQGWKIIPPHNQLISWPPRQRYFHKRKQRHNQKSFMKRLTVIYGLPGGGDLYTHRTKNRCRIVLAGGWNLRRCYLFTIINRSHIKIRCVRSTEGKTTVK